MTPLRFRAWDKARQEFSNGNVAFDCYGMLYWIFGDTARIADREDFVVMQSTGLRDKNGKEIFEGDVVEAAKVGPVLRHRTLVRFEDGAFRISGTVLNEILSVFPQEVIGNIYENPDLLPQAA
jgi:hypothetical protein